MKRRTLLLTITLVTLLLIISAIFLFFPIGNMGKFSVLLFKKRFLKWAVILLVGLCVSISTISFQTIVDFNADDCLADDLFLLDLSSV